MLSSIVSAVALSTLALAVPFKRADAVSGTIAVSSNDASVSTFVGAIDS